jgi:uncharacterized membrane protein YfhO
VTVDGQSVELTNIGDYLAVRAEPGQHRYVFEYAPLSFKLGLAITLISLVVSGLLLSNVRPPTLRWLGRWRKPRPL